ncbi:NAD-binding protein [Persephonella sp.]
MRICIIGAGVVGSYLAKKLSQEGYDIAVIDRDSKKIEDLQITADIAAYHCDAFQQQCIEQVRDYDLYIVATNKDETNLSVALMLKAVFGKERIIVRADKDILSKKEIEDFLGIEIANTFREIYRNIEIILEYPFISYFNELEGGKFIVFSYKTARPDRFTNSKISDLKDIRDKLPFTIVLIERDGKLTVPSGEKVILEGDVLYILLETENLEKFAELAGIKYSPVRELVFLGISPVGLEILGRIYREKNLKIKLIEENIQLCEEVASSYPDVMVINGKITDKEILRSEDTGGADLVISASYREDNILACILAKKLGAKKVLAIIEKPEYEEIAYSLGIDIPIVARKLIARKVYRRIKHRGFIDIFDLKENMRIYEIDVDRSLADKKISQISRADTVILGVVRDGHMEIVSGNYTLKAGDILIVLEKEDGE